MKNFYLKHIKTSAFGKFLHFYMVKLYYVYLSLLSDKKHAETIFNARFSYKLNLKNPKSFNEKIQWLKLYDRTPLHTICADKFKVREYVAGKLESTDILIPLLFYTQNSNDLTSENLPNVPFIIKTNHTSGHYKIVKDKSKVNWQALQKDFKNWLKENIYTTRKEWQYKNIEPCVVVEKLLVDVNGQIPNDYKIHCIEGKVQFIQVDMGRGTERHYRNWYSPNWERMPFIWCAVFDGYKTVPAEYDIPAPKNLSEMLKIAEILSSDFKYARIDLYSHLGKIYFGEITFHHDGGFRPIEPDEWDFKLGELIKL